MQTHNGKICCPGMKNDIVQYIRNFKGCQELKLVRIKNKEPEVITDTLISTFYKILTDTLRLLPTTPNGNKHIFTSQDNLAKYCIAIPVPDIKAVTIADALARNVISIYGAPRVLLSDQAPTLIGKVMQNVEIYCNVRNYYACQYPVTTKKK